MSQVFDALQDRYQGLVTRSFEDPFDEEFLDRVSAFLGDARQAGRMVADAEERGQLRAYMRFLATLLHEANQEAPPIDLLPLDRERWSVRPVAGRTGATVPVWVWILAGAAAVVALGGIVFVGGLSTGAVSLHPVATLPPAPTRPQPTSTVPPTPSPTSTLTPTPTPTPRPASPTFSDLTVALGMLGPSEPFLIGDEFDWNTRAVYAVFDYRDVQDGSSWSVVWAREGEELARESNLWDVGRDGRSGTRWAVYYDPDRFVLQGGAYTVSLYVDGELEDEASFRIQYYTPTTP